MVLKEEDANKLQTIAKKKLKERSSMRLARIKRKRPKRKAKIGLGTKSTRSHGRVGYAKF